jgi:hypothetical protein
MTGNEIAVAVFFHPRISRLEDAMHARSSGRSDSTSSYSFAALATMQIAFPFPTFSASCKTESRANREILANTPKKALAQSKLKDFQEGETVIRKSLWATKRETQKRSEPDQI